MKEKRTLVDGSPVTPDHLEINPLTGQQKDYVVLSAEERAKGFVRPVRRSYIHRGKAPPSNLRDLTDEEKERQSRYGYTDYIKYEEYGEDKAPAVGRYWTQEQLNSVKGCGGLTTMSAPIAETWARDIHFYGATFCAHCGKHLPVDEFVWEGTNEVLGS